MYKTTTPIISKKSAQPFNSLRANRILKCSTEFFRINQLKLAKIIVIVSMACNIQIANATTPVFMAETNIADIQLVITQTGRRTCSNLGACISNASTNQEIIFPSIIHETLNPAKLSVTAGKQTNPAKNSRTDDALYHELLVKLHQDFTVAANTAKTNILASVRYSLNLNKLSVNDEIGIKVIPLPVAVWFFLSCFLIMLYRKAKSTPRGYRQD